ncbi:hypothetical protein ABTW72_04295 [Micromonospora sp. NPDC127501]|uniref:hypothetical protein n=1 Tax=Micromonospora sp. NPDC127501 TaxID=3154872 RepID=UPI00332EA184
MDAIGCPPPPPARKRRNRVALSGPLAKVEGEKALGGLRTSLAARSSPGTLPWMCWPNLMLELVGVDQALVDTVGLIKSQSTSKSLQTPTSQGMHIRGHDR